VEPLERLAAADAFENELFVGLDAGALDLSGKEFYRCVFRQTKLQESSWRRTRLESCLFEDCDLTRLQPAELSARGVRFVRCKLMGTDWTDVGRYPELEFEECDLRYASFVGASLRQIRFLRCKASEANFIDVDLTEADFGGTDLTGSSFQNATLCRAKLHEASGVYFDPAKNHVKEARIAVETAVLLANAAGLLVAGYDAEPDDAPRQARGKGRRPR
jgi:fluoroquinolone resistance protein